MAACEASAGVRSGAKARIAFPEWFNFEMNRQPEPSGQFFTQKIEAP
jgi:hypothetical protein